MKRPQMSPGSQSNRNRRDTFKSKQSWGQCMLSSEIISIKDTYKIKHEMTVPLVINGQVRCSISHNPTSIFFAQSLLHHNTNAFVQDCSNSSVLAMELLQSCTKPSIYSHYIYQYLDYQHSLLATVHDIYDYIFL